MSGAVTPEGMAYVTARAKADVERMLDGVPKLADVIAERDAARGIATELEQENAELRKVLKGWDNASLLLAEPRIAAVLKLADEIESGGHQASKLPDSFVGQTALLIASEIRAAAAGGVL